MVHNTPRNKVDGARLKAMGMVTGVADMVYLNPSGPVTFIEFKTETGRQSPEQKEFERKCYEWGYAYEIVRTFDEFKAAIGSV